MDLLALAERCEHASGPDRDLDVRISAATGGVVNDNISDEQIRLLITEYEYRDHADCLRTCDEASDMGVPHYTSSIDAALTLVPSEMRDEIEITTLYQVARVGINLNHGPQDGPYYGSNQCNSIPLALCAAALRARSAETREDAE